MEMRMKISQTEQFRDAFNISEAEYNTYTAIFYKPMAVEMLDELVTGLVINNGLDPDTLSMSPLEPAGVVYYSPQSLAGSDILAEAAAAKAEAEAAAAADADADAAEDGSAESEAPAEAQVPDPAQSGEGVSSGVPVYAYTVNLNIEGGKVKFYTLMAAIRELAAVELVTYQITDPVETVNPGSTTELADGSTIQNAPVVSRTEGSVSLQLRIYVFSS
jgi:hypothetical protein